MSYDKNQVLHFFKWDHLPPHLQGMSKLFAELAEKLDDMDDVTRGTEGYAQAELLRTKLTKKLPKNLMKELCIDKLREVEDSCFEDYTLSEVLLSLLEAKDCAVRALLLKEET